jgi:hypothetical protein
MPELEGVGRLVFTPREMAVVEGDPRGSGLEAFFRLWTGKEALLKGLGVGFLSDPLEVEVRPASFGFRAEPPPARTGVAAGAVVAAKTAPRALESAQGPEGSWLWAFPMPSPDQAPSRPTQFAAEIRSRPQPRAPREPGSPGRARGCTTRATPPEEQGRRREARPGRGPGR